MRLGSVLFIAVFMTLSCGVKTRLPRHGDFGSRPKIQLALILDVSGSMDGLLKQTISQFWQVIGFLRNGSKEGVRPEVSVAVITYGGDYVQAKTGNLTNTVLVTDFVHSLDTIVKMLYDVKVGGQSEYSWEAIGMAVNELNWSSSRSDLKMVVIAGNESFSQGSGAYQSEKLLRKSEALNISINTIYCSTTGPEAIRSEWANVARMGNGISSSISINDSTYFSETILDARLVEFNKGLNSTYVPYGDSGVARYEELLQLDLKAGKMGVSFFRDRIAYKASESFDNSDWDLVDAYQNDSTIIFRIDPRTIQKSDFLIGGQEGIKDRLEDFLSSREDFRNAIVLRYERIQKYFDHNHGIREALLDMVKMQGSRVGFTFEPAD